MSGKIARAYVRLESDRERMMEAAGLKNRLHVYVYPEEPPVMRKGELLAVFDLTAFGNHHKQMSDAVKAVQQKGGDVVEVETGALAGAGVEMFARAMAIVWGKTRAGKKAEHDKRPRKDTAQRASADELLTMWGGGVKIEKMVKDSGWPQATIYHHFANYGPNKIKLTRDAAKAQITSALKRRKK